MGLMGTFNHSEWLYFSSNKKCVLSEYQERALGSTLTRQYVYLYDSKEPHAIFFSVILLNTFSL